MIDSKGRDFGCFGLAKAETAAQKRKSGRTLPLLCVVIYKQSIPQSKKKLNEKWIVGQVEF